MPKLKSARANPTGIMKNIKAKTILVRLNFFRLKFFSEGVKIKAPIHDPLKVAQAHVPGIEADNRH